MLLEEGAEVNKEEEVKSLTALMAASQCGHDAIVTQLTSCGSLVNAHLKTTKWTAIMLAVLNNQVPSHLPLFLFYFLPPSLPPSLLFPSPSPSLPPFLLFLYLPLFLPLVCMKILNLLKTR